MKSGHRQVCIKVNTRVDRGIAPVVAALTSIPGVCTLNSCEGPAFVSFRFGRDLMESAAFQCWFSRQIVILEGVHVTSEWGGGASIVMTLNLPPHSISNVAITLRKISMTFHSLLFPCGKAHRESRNSTDRHDHFQIGQIYDLPANLIDLILRDLRT